MQESCYRNGCKCLRGERKIKEEVDKWLKSDTKIADVIGRVVRYRDLWRCGIKVVDHIYTWMFSINGEKCEIEEK